MPTWIPKLFTTLVFSYKPLRLLSAIKIVFVRVQKLRAKRVFTIYESETRLRHLADDDWSLE